MVGGGWVSSDGEGVVNFPIFEGKGGGEGRAVELEVEVEKVSGREMASPCFPGSLLLPSWAGHAPQQEAGVGEASSIRMQ